MQQFQVHPWAIKPPLVSKLWTYDTITLMGQVERALLDRNHHQAKKGQNLTRISTLFSWRTRGNWALYRSGGLCWAVNSQYIVPKFWMGSLKNKSNAGRGEPDDLMWVVGRVSEIEVIEQHQRVTINLNFLRSDVDARVASPCAFSLIKYQMFR